MFVSYLLQTSADSDKI